MPDPHGAFGHIPVLVEPILAFRPAVEVGVFVDCTLGAGGHAEKLLEAAPAGIRLIGLDADPAAVTAAAARLARFGDRVVPVHARFDRLGNVLDEMGVAAVHYLIADLGLSSLQLADPSRGFSFEAHTLDMRMDPASGPTAADIVNRAGADELLRIVREYGEDPFAGRIVRAILAARRQRKIAAAAELADIVRGAYPAPVRRKSRIDPATRTFQALRMAVNDEPGRLATLLRTIPERLAAGGRAAVIAFHSLEDRPVKQAFRAAAKTGGFADLTKKPVEATDNEISANPRARSAKLRVIERLR